MTKRLQIDYIKVRDVKFGEKTSLDKGVLTVNKEDLLKEAASDLFGSLDIQLVRPGENCRILGLHDVMQPRCKADHPEESYPGIWGKLAPAAKGAQWRLKASWSQTFITLSATLNIIWIWAAHAPNTAISRVISTYA